MEYVPFACWLWASIVIAGLTVNSGINFLYASKMIFEVMRPKDHDGPLHEKAVQFAEQHPEIMMARRAYAIEAWLTSWVAAVGAAFSPWLWYLTYLSWPL